MPRPRQPRQRYTDPTGYEFSGGPEYASEFCGETVYDGNASGRTYNAGLRPLTQNAHDCIAGPPTTRSFAGANVTAEDIPFEEPQQEGVPVPEGLPEWVSTPLPPGPFAWVSYPVEGVRTAGVLQFIGTERADYPELIVALREWGVQNGLGVEIGRNQGVSVHGLYLQRPQRFNVGPLDTPVTGIQPWAAPFECPLCGEEHIAYTVRCGETSLFCHECGLVTNSIHAEGRTLHSAGDSLVCSTCGASCETEGCESLTRRYDRWCAEHGDYRTCGPCGSRFGFQIGGTEFEEWVSTEDYDAVCPDCQDCLCSTCQAYTHNLTVTNDGRVCRRCFFTEITGGIEGEEFDAAESEVTEIPSIPGREVVRLCGVEIEGANGTSNGNALAEAFYRNDLSSTDSMTGYHGGRDTGFAHVERDSSVDWEAVLGPLNAAEPDDMAELNTAVRVIRTMVKDGTLGLDLRAGCHIHVEAARVSLDGAFNLNTLFAYLEDVMFRLGAARWPVHRAVANDEYTIPVLKEERKLAFARFHESPDEDTHHFALSFHNYFSRMLNNCRCGATRYDSWEDCTCELGKCTFEFRVFNTTANPRKLHAYLALSQAMVAKAAGMGKLDSPLMEFPPLTFEPRRFKDMSPTNQEQMVVEWQRRLQWMFRELPLTDDEKESIAYCVRHSELVSVGDDYINELLPAQQHIEEAIA
jgi:hypothetical protein